MLIILIRWIQNVILKDIELKKRKEERREGGGDYI